MCVTTHSVKKASDLYYSQETSKLPLPIEHGLYFSKSHLHVQYTEEGRNAGTTSSFSLCLDCSWLKNGNNNVDSATGVKQN